eukprot:COSAG02_NODE_18191_length_953_cov_1.863158_1_plen_198_part_10
MKAAALFLFATAAVVKAQDDPGGGDQCALCHDSCQCSCDDQGCGDQACQDCHSACDSDGPCGGGGGAPPACILDQLMPFMVAEDEPGMMQYLCSDQLDTSVCDDAELADINDICLEIPDVVAQECGSSSDQKVGLVEAGAATDGEGGFTELDGAAAVSTFERDGSTYAIVAARDDDGIQIVDVSDPSNPVAVSSATDG